MMPQGSLRSAMQLRQRWQLNIYDLNTGSLGISRCFFMARKKDDNA